MSHVVSCIICYATLRSDEMIYFNYKKIDDYHGICEQCDADLSMKWVRVKE